MYGSLKVMYMSIETLAHAAVSVAVYHCKLTVMIGLPLVDRQALATTVLLHATN